jgi:pimeloyl-ACP methyl ester carboxylesterase
LNATVSGVSTGDACNSRLALIFLLAVPVLLSGCGTYFRHGLDSARAASIEQATLKRSRSLKRDQEDKILALDPEHVTEKDIRETLAGAPAPRIVNIHGGVARVVKMMVSFSDFLAGMGYPMQSITNAADGSYTFSCYENSEMIAGVIAWYYEKDGLRPMIVGHSQGGMQAVKVLDKFAARSPAKLAVWNPLTWARENRYEITDPLTGQKRPVVGLQLSYATSVAAGGLARIMPNQWDMAFRLRTIPDSVEEFTGFYKRNDVLGSDLLGYGEMNLFKASGAAKVRNVELPASLGHASVPKTRHLVKTQELRVRINAYTPDKPMSLDDPANKQPETLNLMWAEDVWYSIKKHWVLELQRLIKARRAAANGQ